MRPKDWADHEADRLHEAIIELGDDYDQAVDEIAKSLRKAARDFHEDRVTGPVGEHPEV